MYQIRKKIRVEYAHQLFDSYTTLCHETIHGHSGIIELYFKSDDLDDNKMVIDFGELSDNVKKFIMEKYDHALFIPKQFSQDYIDTLKKYNKRLTITDDNPTCEKFAEMIYNEVEQMIDHIPNIFISKVVFHETETGFAEYWK